MDCLVVTRNLCKQYNKECNSVFIAKQKREKKEKIEINESQVEKEIEGFMYLPQLSQYALMLILTVYFRD